MKQNPYGKVPVLVDNDGVIYESAIINEYLDEKFADIPLMPRNQLDRAKVRIWVDFFNTRVHPTGSDSSLREASLRETNARRLSFSRSRAGRWCSFRHRRSSRTCGRAMFFRLRAALVPVSSGMVPDMS